jgi:glycyl-tRNA synthetase beta chain
MADKKNNPVKAESLLVELLTEELPPKSLAQLGMAFSKDAHWALKDSNLLGAGSTMRWFATPRRLGFLISDVLRQASDRQMLKKIMPVSVALDGDGNPTQALKKKLAAENIPLSEVPFFEKKPDGKTVTFFHTVPVIGERLDVALPIIVETALKKLPIAKRMRWGAGDAQFARPVHGLVMMHGARVVSGDVMGLASGNHTLGHRFLSSGKITIANADSYEQTLLTSGSVIADYATRRSEIFNKINNLCDNSRIAVASDALYDEITALVEAPTVYEGTFSEDFLSVPEECLILSMQQHQKYVPLRDQSSGKLLPRFLFVSNIETKEPGEIIRGNERVLRARLADAKFFFEQDKKINLPDRVPALGRVVYQNKLGTQLDRVERIKNLAEVIGKMLGFPEQELYSVNRAAYWCKCDLLTEMVGEFPELQGVMGKYYLIGTDKSWDVPQIAQAIEEHYRPRFSGDKIPESKIGACVALADKLDVLIGIFGIDQRPTGDRDPFALRRHALGVVRILCEHGLPLDLYQLLKTAQNNFPSGLLIAAHKRGEMSIPNDVEVGLFVEERAKNHLRDLGYSVLEVESVLDLRPKPSQYIGRLDAVREFLKLPEASGLAEADKRIRNILSKSDANSIVQRADEAGLKEDAEKQLLRITRLLREQVDTLVEANKFRDALLLTAQIHQPVSRLFDQVMINVENVALRNNRFALLHEVGNLTNRVAHIYKLAA